MLTECLCLCSCKAPPHSAHLQPAACLVQLLLPDGSQAVGAACTACSHACIGGHAAGGRMRSCRRRECAGVAAGPLCACLMQQYPIQPGAPLERHSTCTGTPIFRNVSRLGAKNMDSSSGWAMISNTPLGTYGRGLPKPLNAASGPTMAALAAMPSSKKCSGETRRGALRTTRWGGIIGVEPCLHH